MAVFHREGFAFERDRISFIVWITLHLVIIFSWRSRLNITKSIPMKCFFTVLLLAACSGLQAQKVDLDKFIFTASYQEFPNALIDTSYHTYSVSVTGSTGTPVLGSANTTNQVNEAELIERVSIQGWKKLPKAAHVNINTAFEPVVMRNWEVKERVQISKGKTDKDTIRTTYYHIEITYSFAATSEMKDYKGNSIWREEIVSHESKQVYKTQELNAQFARC